MTGELLRCTTPFTIMLPDGAECAVVRDDMCTVIGAEHDAASYTQVTVLLAANRTMCMTAWCTLHYWSVL